MEKILNKVIHFCNFHHALASIGIYLCLGYIWPELQWENSIMTRIIVAPVFGLITILILGGMAATYEKELKNYISMLWEVSKEIYPLIGGVLIILFLTSSPKWIDPLDLNTCLAITFLFTIYGPWAYHHFCKESPL